MSTTLPNLLRVSKIEIYIYIYIYIYHEEETNLTVFSRKLIAVKSGRRVCFIPREKEEEEEKKSAELRGRAGHI